MASNSSSLVAAKTPVNCSCSQHKPENYEDKARGDKNDSLVTTSYISLIIRFATVAPNATFFSSCDKRTNINQERPHALC